MCVQEVDERGPGEGVLNVRYRALVLVECDVIHEDQGDVHKRPHVRVA